MFLSSSETAEIFLKPIFFSYEWAEDVSRVQFSYLGFVDNSSNKS